jgi:Uncharacterized protein, homolog of Cu resistance protein CopC
VQLSFRSRAVSALLAALAVIVTPALLFAHAHLVRSTPAVNGRVTTPPSALSLWFSEQPEVRFTSLQLLDSAGNAVSLGAVALIPGNSMGISAPVTGTMTAGKYTVVWRTAAADGHATSGKFAFVVTSSVAPAATVAPVLPESARDTAGKPAPTAQSIPNAVGGPSNFAGFSPAFRWAEFVALLTLVGAMIFRLFILRDANLPSGVTADAVDRTRRLAKAVLILFAITTVWRVAAEADLMPTAGSARFSAMMSVVRYTQWGHGWLVGGVGVVIVAVALIFGSGSFAAWVLAGLGVVGMCLGESLTGHAAALPHRTALAISTDVAHLLSAGGWLGGLAVVLLCGLPATRRGGTSDPRRAGQQLVRAYHRAAVECVVLVLVTALIASWLRLTAVSDLWTTSYGSMLFRKIIFVLIALGIGFYHWRSAVIPEWGDDTRFRFQRSGVGELLIGAVILGLTALLVATALPRT